MLATLRKFLVGLVFACPIASTLADVIPDWGANAVAIIAPEGSTIHATLAVV